MVTWSRFLLLALCSALFTLFLVRQCSDRHLDAAWDKSERRIAENASFTAERSLGVSGEVYRELLDGISGKVGLEAPSPDVAGSVADDAEWWSLPRSKLGIITLLVAPRLDRVKELFRHESLNPADVYIPKDARDSFMKQMKERIDGIRAAETAIVRAEFADFNSLVKAGRSGQFSLTQRVQELSDPARQAYEKAVREAARDLAEGQGISVDELDTLPTPILGAMFPGGKEPDFVRKEGDTIYFSSRRELSSAREMRELYNHLRMTLAADVLAWFGQVALVPEHRVSLLREKVFAKLYPKE